MSSAAQPKAIYPAGTRVGPYEIERYVGSGAFADVYQARHIDLDNRFALKVVLSAEAADRELQGARIMTRLRHPNVVSVVGVEQYEGRLVIAMDYAEGESLSKVIAARHALDRQESLRIARSVAKALVLVHELRFPDGSSVAHLDVKPANVILCPDGQPRLVDFGVAQLVEASADGSLRGSPAYMAPEQVRGGPCQASDIWACGVSLYEMLTGARPFEMGSSPLAVGIGADVWKQLPERLKRIDGDIADVIGRCLNFEPDARPNAKRLAAELEALPNTLSAFRCPKCQRRLPDGATECPDCTMALKKEVEKTPLELTASRPPRRWPIVAGALVMVSAAGAWLGWQNWDRVVSLKLPTPIAIHSQQPVQDHWESVQPALSDPAADPAAVIAQLERFIAGYPNSTHLAEAQAQLAEWRTEANLLLESQSFASQPATRMSGALTRWKQTAELARLPAIKARATREAEGWQQRLDQYKGFAILTVDQASGLPELKRPLLGGRLASAFFVLWQGGAELYRSKTIPRSPNPSWGEHVRVSLAPDENLVLELDDEGLLSKHLLLKKNLMPLPADGKFQVSDGSVVLDLEIAREQ